VCVGRLVRAPRFEPLMAVEPSGPYGLLARYNTAIRDRLGWLPLKQGWLPPPVAHDKRNPLDDVLVQALGLELPP
jgi:hypothetical protein